MNLGNRHQRFFPEIAVAWLDGAPRSLRCLASLVFLALGGCQTTAFIYYDEPLTFGNYQDLEKNVFDGGALFTSFKIQEVENLSKSAPVFNFDPTHVQILNFPPLPDGPNGQPPASARQTPYATRPAVAVSVAPGTSSGNTFIGNYVFRINPGATGVNGTTRFRLIYNDAPSGLTVSMQPRPSADPEVQHTVGPRDLVQRGI